jgi:hypothetical protein
MSSGRRWALLGAFVLAAVVALIALRPDGGAKKQTAVTSRSAPTEAGGTAAKPQPPPIRVIRVVGGKPVGGIAKLEVAKGDRVRFAVRSDVADEIHVHGYDLMRDVAAGETVRFDFPAKIDGDFVIELEHRGEQIADLKVQP